MLDHIAQFIARHRLFEPGQRVGIAVSGGAASAARTGYRAKPKQRS
jgi:tRNA(Ile)-lysidine synthase TilS/MesJ